MTQFGKRSTAEDVLAGVDLAGKTVLITGCNNGIGFETMKALAAHGAQIVGLARSVDAARDAARRAGATITPVACDLADLASVRAAIATVQESGLTLDAIVANAGIMGLPRLETIHGVEKQFFVNHLAHFLLVTRLLGQMRDGAGRIVIVSSSASIQMAPKAGILFDNLDGAKGYKPLKFYGQSKLANALFAKELSRRAAARGIAVNALHPGVINTNLARNMHFPWTIAMALARPFMKTPAQGAATQTFLAANPQAAGVTGEFWADCHVAPGSRYLEDRAMAARLWDVSEDLLARTARG